MDALSKQAIKSLLGKNLPGLTELLTALESKGDHEKVTLEELNQLLDDTSELLSLLQTWAQGQNTEDADFEADLEDEDGDDLLEQMEADTGPIGESVLEMKQKAKKDPDASAPSQDSNEEDLGVELGEEESEASDEEAMAMLNQEDDEVSDDDAMAMLNQADPMDAANEAPETDIPSDMVPPIEEQTPTAQSSEEEIQKMADDEEMSDDEALALLSQMDDPVEEAPPAKKPEPAEDMSDDEALALLSQMDEPAPTPSPPAKGDANEEMSDEAAQALLAQMDGSEPAAEDEGDACDDAEALLAQLGGEDDEEESPPPPKAQAKPEAPAPSGSAHPDLSPEDTIEIEEWEPNDFQTDPDMVNDFNTNSEEIMETLDEQVLKLEQDPTSTEIIEEIFRAAHTLKGAAGMFGFKGLERVMHRMENLFDLVRKGKLTPTSVIVDVMFEGLDVVRELLEAVKDGKPKGLKTAPIVMKLTLAAKGKYDPAESAKAESGGGDEGGGAEINAKPAGGGGGDDRPEGASKEKKKEASTIRVDLQRLDALVNLIGELVIDRTRFVTIEEELRTNYPEVKLSGNISETVQLFGRHMNEIQDIIMKVRMVPIGNAFNKYPRIIRDLAKQLGKQIDLVISGESAELDKTLVEQIGDPLIHLIRNSCDHGIELPEDRKNANKPATGTIWLSAHQEGNHIVISIEDDGKGIPHEIIRRKAIEKGMIAEEDKLSKREIFNLIFEPGFSTAEKVSNISGRGVGMDVVKKQIMKLKGLLEVDSEEGQGTTITIRLPLTLAIVQSLLVKVKDEIFAIPLSSVIESIRISNEDIQKIGETEVIKLRDKVLPLMHLEDELHLNKKTGTIADHIMQTQLLQKKAKRKKVDRYFVVVVGQPDRPFGILVDQLLNQQEMVIKSMGRLMRDIPYMAGGAVLGNGEVVLVLDIPELEEAFTMKSRGIAA